MGARYQLLVLDGAHRGETYPLKGGRFTSGRKEKNDLVLQESTVSGFHLEIAVEGEALILRDLGSTNGTLLDGRRIDEVPLAHGDTFSVGSIRIRLVDSEGGPLAESGATRLGGRIPINTSGGLESRGHPVGASGLAQIHELVAQLRHEAGPRQVENCRLALAENGGGNIGFEEAAMCIHILERVAWE